MLARIHDEMIQSLSHLDDCTKGKVLLAYVNYQLYDIEPSQDDILVYSIFKAKQFDLEAMKKDIKASSENGKKGGRPVKNFDNSQKPKHNLKQPNDNLNQPNDNLTESEKEIEKEIDKENINISSNDDNSKAVYGNKEINDLIGELKEQCNQLGVAYEKKDERNFAKHILTAKDYGDFAEKIGQSRTQFAKNILIASCQLKYKGICAGPKAIYQHYAEIYNEFMKNKPKMKAVILDDL